MKEQNAERTEKRQRYTEIVDAFCVLSETALCNSVQFFQFIIDRNFLLS